MMLRRFAIGFAVPVALFALLALIILPAQYVSDTFGMWWGFLAMVVELGVIAGVCAILFDGKADLVVIVDEREDE